MCHNTHAMGTSERKQRERAEREELILDVGRKMLLKDGYHGLSMDRIAEEIEYSKGIVYQHFASKDDLLCGISINLLREGLAYFHRASQLPGRPRERFTAIAVASQLLFRLHPDSFQAQLIIWVNAIADRAPQERREAMGQLQGELHALLVSIVDDAVARNDLRLPPGVTPHSVMHGMWTMLIGAELSAQAPKLSNQCEAIDPATSARQNIQRLWDGYGWKPLSTVWDYAQTEKRTLTEVFPEEYQALQRAGRNL